MTDSSIPTINLIPQEKIEHHIRSRWISKWMIAVAGVAILIGIPGLYIGGSTALTDSGMAEQIERAHIEYARHQQEIPLLQKQLRLLAAEQEVLSLVENRIEWREVFSVLVNTSENEVRFRRISVTGGGVEGDQTIHINIEGLAPTQTIARGYVVDLEDIDVFDSVELVETTREIINKVELIRFRINITVISDMKIPAEANDAG